METIGIASGSSFSRLAEVHGVTVRKFTWAHVSSGPLELLGHSFRNVRSMPTHEAASRYGALGEGLWGT